MRSGPAAAEAQRGGAGARGAHGEALGVSVGDDRGVPRGRPEDRDQGGYSGGQRPAADRGGRAPCDGQRGERRDSRHRQDRYQPPVAGEAGGDVDSPADGERDRDRQYQGLSPAGAERAPQRHRADAAHRG